MRNWELINALESMRESEWQSFQCGFNVSLSHVSNTEVIQSAMSAVE